jgi:hypothetical protein
MGFQKNLLCTVEFGGEKFQADIHLEQLDTSTVVAKITPNTLVNALSTECFMESGPEEQPLRLLRTNASLTSMLHPSGESGMRTEINVRLERAEFKYSPFIDNEDKVSVQFYVTNLPYFQRDKQHIISVSGQEVAFSPFKEGAISNLVEINDVPYSSLEEVKEIISSICWLASFGCGRLSGIARTEVFRNHELVYLDLRSIMTEFKPNIQVIYSDFGSLDITQFILECFDEYRRVRDIYLLNNLIHMSIFAKNTPYRENRALLMSNFLEILRYNYALNVGVPTGWLKLEGIDFIWQTGSKKNKKASFMDILQQFCQENNITAWRGDFKDLRNEIVHTGKIEGTNPLERYFGLHHFCDVVILSLLKWDHQGGRYIPINCPSFNGPNKWGMNIIKFIR